ncbi:MAG: hypothetical protein A3H50_01060 [Candidatus Levybacteria bacterium RIFCSPLOWO2_02_FULL_37_10]|nr:MAG: hypothetical protein A2860_04800 [Candidatus Levybacteria bacterium RIFCSPHIGHO2_01_FULL_37_33]OGH15994.1 MAG: hypothetical protein A3C97_02105 [Candidatus Levybacteria bacterium RIFCSPHIGHO2_02_FULL_37_11]OGH29761.1 MAG: hypothetical protein A3F30_00175 [Candidatus Levybacteria bacterium RIFCSPHIGHO2_12_FULL_37_12]OGH32955.1 MAG: hypothetical protein A2953_00105 [Candidatus Levybacteria bacterium RIFCSPLOWO2_01_FULL_36_54]OGH43240.1 MAG: hypothetical protein A3H50_01060 [Candidatus Lev
MKYSIIPGILEKDWPVIEMKIQQVLPFAKAIHIDLIDGKFAPNTTFLDPAPFKKYTQDIPFELHMMVDEPINFLKPWADAGFRRFIGHIEKMSDQVEFVAKAQLLGEVGLGVDQGSEIDAIEVPLSDLDVLLFMTVKAGFSNQEFVEKNLEKIKKAREKSFVSIEVDGGINDQTILRAKESGADRFVATSFIFKGTPQEQYKKLQETLLH